MKTAAARRSIPGLSMRLIACKAFSFALVLASVTLMFGFSTTTFAHHGFGLFDRSQDAVFTGTIKSIDFVNPHSCLYLDADTAEGDTIGFQPAVLQRRVRWLRHAAGSGCTLRKPRLH